MRDDYVEKTMLGQKVSGYICVNPNEDIPDEVMVFEYACDSLGLPSAKDRKVKPIVYEVEGTSKIKDYLETDTERLYCICKDIKLIRKLSTQDLINSTTQHSSHVQRLISYYPLDLKEALILAKMYNKNYYLLSLLHETFIDSEEINNIFIAAEKENKEESKEKKYVKE